MKKSLLATTALAALGAVAVASPAAAKFEVGVGGFMEQWFGYADNANSANPSQDVFSQHSDTEIHFKAAQTLDNGMKFAVTVEMEGEDGSIDEQYLTIDGSFGRIQLGSEDQVGRQMHYNTGSKGIGIEEGDITGAWIAGTTGTLGNTNTHVAVSSDANNISYYTPRISGFMVGASFIPDQDSNDTREANDSTEVDGVRDNSFAVAANYQGSFDALTIGVSAGYTDGGANVAGSEMAFSAGVRLGFGGFNANFAYGEHDRDDGAAQNVNTFGFGLGYQAGPAGVSLGYVRGEDSPADDKQDLIELGASYAVGPGITARGALYYAERVTAGQVTADGVAVVGGLALNF
jgi:predicted porin